MNPDGEGQEQSAPDDSGFVNPYETDAPIQPSAHAGEESFQPPIPPEGTIIGRLVDSWWACVFVPILAVGVALVVGVVGFVIAAYINSGGNNPFQRNPQELISEIVSDPVLLIAMLLPNQLTFLLAGAALALFSNARFRGRLGLGAGFASIATWPVYVLATPAVGIVISLLMSNLIDQESSNMKMVEDIVTAQVGPKFLIAIALIAVAPAICEEVLFRGFAQHRLLKIWPAWAAILVSSILFALAHVEPIHVIAVFPLGLWFGFIAWKTGSIIPCMLCHFANNLLSLLAMQFGIEEEGNETLLLGIAGVSGIFLLASIALMLMPRRGGDQNAIA